MIPAPPYRIDARAWYQSFMELDKPSSTSKTAPTKLHKVTNSFRSILRGVMGGQKWYVNEFYLDPLLNRLCITYKDGDGEDNPHFMDTDCIIRASEYRPLVIYVTRDEMASALRQTPATTHMVARMIAIVYKGNLYMVSDCTNRWNTKLYYSIYTEYYHYQPSFMKIDENQEFRERFPDSKMALVYRNNFEQYIKQYGVAAPE